MMFSRTSVLAVRRRGDVIGPGIGAVRLLVGSEGPRAGVGAGTRTTEGSTDPGRQGPVGVRAPSVTAGGANDGTAGPPVLGTEGIAVPRTGGH